MNRKQIFDKFNNVIPNNITRLFLETQDWAINQIAQQVATYGKITESAAHIYTTIVEQDIFMRDFELEIYKRLSIPVREIETFFPKIFEQYYEVDNHLFKKREIQTIPFEENWEVKRAVDRIIENTKGEMRNISRSTGFAIKTPQGMVYKPIAKYYHDVIDRAVVKIDAGLQSFTDAIKEAVVEMADSGMRTIDYESGVKHRIDVAARRAVMGASRDLTNLQSDYNASMIAESGEPAVFEISWHGGHRPSHLWGGRRYDESGRFYLTEQQLYEKYAAPDGTIGTLNDYNCYHFKYAVFPDSDPTYTDEELEEFEKEELVEKEFEGKKYNAYAARQQQRAIERKLRKANSIIAGYKNISEMKDELTQAKIKMKMLEKQYSDFSKAMGLRTEYERVDTGYVE